jgi:hypothetical protein
VQGDFLTGEAFKLADEGAFDGALPLPMAAALPLPAESSDEQLVRQLVDRA